MTAAILLERLCAAIDAHDWDALPPLLSADFRCRYVHTGEEFDAPAWVRLNAGYPGFERMQIEELVADGDRAVARCHVTSSDGRFAVATFVAAQGERISSMTEVWTDVAQSAPPGTRPESSATTEGS